MSDLLEGPKPELLPCPFCGGDPTLIVGSVAFNDYEVQCDTCGFSGPNFGSLDQEPFPREDAIKHWNTRQALDALLKAEREKALREAAEVCFAEKWKPKCSTDWVLARVKGHILALIEKDATDG